MASTSLAGILDQVKSLSSAEQRELRAKLDGLLNESALYFDENQLEHKLLEAGLIREIKAPITDFTPYQNRRPVKLKAKGNAASDSIIEERR